MSNDIDFNTNDVITVAKTLIEDSVLWDNGSENSMNARDGYYCEYCNASEIQYIKDFKHDLDCPVLVAQDLLTLTK